MTREEAIEALTSKDVSIMLEALDMAINALEQLTSYEQTINKLTKAISEQEPILDKIRAEIKSLSNANPSYWHSGDMVDREEVLDIIDKYRGEVDCRECKAEYECYYCKKYAESEES